MSVTDNMYSLDDRPAFPVLFLLGIQHVCIIAISFIFPVLLVRYIGGTAEQGQFMVSMSMLAGGIGVIIQSLKKGPVGSGYLCPTVCGPSFLASSMLCAKTGGLSLVLGMTMFAGVVEGLFSRILNKIRVLFPPEITGVIVAMVGISVIQVAEVNLFGAKDNTFNITVTITGLLTLFIMVGLNIWTKGNVKLFCILIGMTCGYIISIFMGVLTMEEIKQAMNAPLVWFPFVHHPGWSFSWAMVIPMIVAMLCSSLKSIGDLSTCQKINDPKWTKPDIGNLKKGLLADALACFSSGVVGGMGQSTSSTNIGLSIATGATSRIIAFSTGLILIVLSFFPKISAIFTIMPAPVIGATLVFALSFMIVAGFQIVMSRMIDARKTFVIGISIIFGLMTDLMPEPFHQLPGWLQPICSSSLSASTVLAVLLNLLFRIGIKSTAVLRIDYNNQTTENVFNFFERYGKSWAARPEVINKARSAVNEYVELVRTNHPEGKMKIKVQFDELNLRVDLYHDDECPELFKEQPSYEKLARDDSAFIELSGYLINTFADKVKTRKRQDRTKTTLQFVH